MSDPDLCPGCGCIGWECLCAPRPTLAPSAHDEDGWVALDDGALYDVRSAIAGPLPAWIGTPDPTPEWIHAAVAAATVHGSAYIVAPSPEEAWALAPRVCTAARRAGHPLVTVAGTAVRWGRCWIRVITAGHPDLDTRSGSWILMGSTTPLFRAPSEDS